MVVFLAPIAVAGYMYWEKQRKEREAAERGDTEEEGTSSDEALQEALASKTSSDGSMSDGPCDAAALSDTSPNDSSRGKTPEPNGPLAELGSP